MLTAAVKSQEVRQKMNEVLISKVNTDGDQRLG